MKFLRLISLWGPVVAFMVVIYSLGPQPELARVVHTWDKPVHVLGYGLFAALCLRAFHSGWKPLTTGRSLLAILLCLAYGAIDEWHQSQVPGRDASFQDWLADLLGAALAWAFVGWFVRRTAVRRRRRVT